MSLTVGRLTACDRAISIFTFFSCSYWLFSLLFSLLFSSAKAFLRDIIHYTTFLINRKHLETMFKLFLGRQYFDKLNRTQSRISSHYVITRSYTFIVQASDNPRQKCWDKIDYWEQIQLSQRAYLTPHSPSQCCTECVVNLQHWYGEPGLSRVLLSRIVGQQFFTVV